MGLLRAWTSTLASAQTCLMVMMAGGPWHKAVPVYKKYCQSPLPPVVSELPIAEHIIHRFTDIGVQAHHSVVNYKKNMIKSYFNDLKGLHRGIRR